MSRPVRREAHIRTRQNVPKVSRMSRTGLSERGSDTRSDPPRARYVAPALALEALAGMLLRAVSSIDWKRKSARCSR